MIREYNKDPSNYETNPKINEYYKEKVFHHVNNQ